MPKVGEMVTDKLPNGGSVTYEYHAPIAVDVAKELADAKQVALAAVDSAAGAVRGRYVTSGLLQQQVYDLKAAEAEAYIAAAYPADTTSYPLISGEAAITGQTVRQLADVIVATKAAWLAIAGQIEGERIAGKTAVNAAIDAASVETAKSSALVALAAI